MASKQKSNELRQQVAVEDNDFKAMSLHTKIIREDRAETFEENYLWQLQEKFTVSHDQHTGKYTIDTSMYGVVDFFPKANKLLIRRSNKWLKPGLQWMIKHLHISPRATQ
jgi:hypothetical protein